MTEARPQRWQCGGCGRRFSTPAGQSVYEDLAEHAATSKRCASAQPYLTDVGPKKPTSRPPLRTIPDC